MCTCGKGAVSCPFWSDVLQRTGFWEAGSPTPCSFPTEVSSGGRWLKRLGLLRRTQPKDIDAYRRFAQALLEAASEVTGRRVFVDASKIPHRLDWLVRSGAADAWDLRVIHVIRNGLGVASGYKRRGRSVLRGALSWRLRHARIKRLISSLAPAQNFMQLHYEELCSDPAGTTQRICEFIDVPFDPDMLNFRSRIQHQLGGNKMRFSSDKDIRLDERWKTEITSWDKIVFRAIAGRVQRRLGYRS